MADYNLENLYNVSVGRTVTGYTIEFDLSSERQPPEKHEKERKGAIWIVSVRYWNPALIMASGAPGAKVLCFRWRWLAELYCFGIHMRNTAPSGGIVGWWTAEII